MNEIPLKLEVQEEVRNSCVETVDEEEARPHGGREGVHYDLNRLTCGGGGGGGDFSYAGKQED